jgi:hypothetical protein
MCGGQTGVAAQTLSDVTSPTPGAAITNTGGGQSHNHNLSANFSGSANSVLQPYLVLIYIIKT